MRSSRSYYRSTPSLSGTVGVDRAGDAGADAADAVDAADTAGTADTADTAVAAAAAAAAVVGLPKVLRPRFGPRSVWACTILRRGLL